jgi:hypothetical protein
MITFRNHHSVREAVHRARVLGALTVVRHNVKVCPEWITVTFLQHGDEPWKVSVVLAESEAVDSEWILWRDDELGEAPDWVRRFVEDHKPHDNRIVSEKYLRDTQAIIGRLRDCGL